jgi:phosphoribosylformylglycinamidine synthase PurS subunit
VADAFYKRERYEVVAAPTRATVSVGLIAYAAALAQMHVSICAPPAPGGYVARVVIDVMLKPEIHDPQGDAIADSAQRLGYSEVRSVRQGKRFEVEIDGPADDAALEKAAKLAADLLANPVIEEFSVHPG